MAVRSEPIDERAGLVSVNVRISILAVAVILRGRFNGNMLPRKQGSAASRPDTQCVDESECDVTGYFES